ncbi:MAG: type II toxin-antitoxin system Phd/YefM family antitoxin [Pseudomonadota bacterium]
MHTISATELARRTREILDGIARGGETVAIERNRVVIAQLTAPDRTMTAAQAFAGLAPVLTGNQGRDWLRDSRTSDFDEAVRDPWA